MDLKVAKDGGMRVCNDCTAVFSEYKSSVHTKIHTGILVLQFVQSPGARKMRTQPHPGSATAFPPTDECPARLSIRPLRVPGSPEIPFLREDPWGVSLVECGEAGPP